MTEEHADKLAGRSRIDTLCDEKAIKEFAANLAASETYVAAFIDAGGQLRVLWKGDAWRRLNLADVLHTMTQIALTKAVDLPLEQPLPADGHYDA
jgi:hypothetical protein